MGTQPSKSSDISASGWRTRCVTTATVVPVRVRTVRISSPTWATCGHRACRPRQTLPKRGASWHGQDGLVRRRRR
jgi:hypothetical protein